MARSSKEKRSRKEQKKRKKRRGQHARRADRYALYQQAVQEPDVDCALMERIFRKGYGRRPRVLREDFCGTALLACRWVERHRENHATGIDLDPEPLEWGRRHNLARLSPEQAARVKLIEGDVRDIGCGKVDVTVAFNFSYFVFRTREELVRYFRAARSGLRAEGLFMLDAYGGADAQRTCQEKREIDGFDYVWDQHRFDPIQHRVVNYIHFEFPDGSRMRRAFRYDWRLWTLPEIQELLTEAGFSRVDVYWENTDSETGEGNDVFVRRTSADDDPAWVCYIAALV